MYSLEKKLQSELELPGIAASPRCVDRAVRRIANLRVRLSKVRGIAQIERLCAELQLYASANGKRFEAGEVKHTVGRAVEKIAVARHIRSEGLRLERGGIEPTIDTLYRHDGRIANKHSPFAAAGDTCVRVSSSINNAEWYSSGKYEGRIRLPTRYELPRDPPGAAPKRQRVVQQHRKPITDIEIRVPIVLLRDQARDNTVRRLARSVVWHIIQAVSPCVIRI